MFSRGGERYRTFDGTQSGSGKSHTIRCINRMKITSSGRIIVMAPSELNTMTSSKIRDGGTRKWAWVPALQFCSCTLSYAELHLSPMWVRRCPNVRPKSLAMHFWSACRIPEQALNILVSYLGQPTAACGQLPGTVASTEKSCCSTSHRRH